MNEVKLIECPREAWQALSPIPTMLKADYLRALVAAGFTHVDALSFVSGRALPQMADADDVLGLLEAPGFDPRVSDAVEMMALVANVEGAERALATSAIPTLVFPYSISPTFLERNQRQTPEEALEELEKIGEAAYKAGADVVARIGMAFGNPYGDAWDVDEVVSAVDLLVDAGVDQVTLADTHGKASPELLADVLRLVRDVHEEVELGAALHVAGDAAEARVKAVFGAGCRRFDAVLGGGGSEPLAGEWLPGLVATEELLPVLTQLGADLPPLSPMTGLVRAARELSGRYALRVN